MIIIKIWGGLGNQLFQYAFGYALANDCGKKLYLDTEFYKKQYAYVGYRKFLLDQFFDDYEILHKREGVVKLFESFVINRMIQRWKKGFCFKWRDTLFIKEKKRTYMPDINITSKKCYFDGYWQTGLYFEKYHAEIKEKILSYELMSVQAKEMLKSEKECNSVSIHIRRGDFAKSKKIGHLVELDYYYKAIAFIEERIDNPVFFVFSDDIQWVKENLDVDAEMIYADYQCTEGEIADLILMANCKHGIMSASTFSWWGNWLKKDAGIVIAPKGICYNNEFIDETWVQM